MITDQAADDVLSEVFAQHAEDRPDAQLVLADLRQRLDRPRHITSRPVAALAAAATVAALAIASTVLSDRGAKSSPAGKPTPAASTSHPGEDQLTTTCLNMAQVLAAWGNPSTGYGGHRHQHLRQRPVLARGRHHHADAPARRVLPSCRGQDRLHRTITSGHPHRLPRPQLH